MEDTLIPYWDEALRAAIAQVPIRFRRLWIDRKAMDALSAVVPALPRVQLALEVVARTDLPITFYGTVKQDTPLHFTISDLKDVYAVLVVPNPDGLTVLGDWGGVTIWKT